MAHFPPALKATLRYEGGYCHIPGDAGGETYCGVARVYFPGNEIWGIIDRIKKSGPLKYNQIIGGTDGEALNRLIADFYKTEFWDKMRGDEIQSQSVAAYLFDWNVNSGNVAAKQLQGILGVTADGVIGNQTLRAINGTDAGALWRKLVDLRVQRARNKVARDQSQAKFLKGWLTRFQSFAFDDTAAHV